MNYDQSQLFTWLKSMSRPNPLPVDASEIWESLSDAQAYIKQANAYAGQTIKAKLEDGKFHTYVIQPSDGGYVLEEVGGSNVQTKQYVQIVSELPEDSQEQGVLYINTTNNTGSIWTGSAWKTVCTDLTAQVAALESELDEKAPLANPAFTGTVTINGKEAATKEYAESLVSGIQSFSPGVVSSSAALPTENYKIGQSWRVAEAGTYAGATCEVGDLILCIANYSESFDNADFMVIQANIDGAVTGADSSVDGNIVVFDGTTGKIIKDSAVTIASLNDVIAKAHTHTNKTILDSFTKNQDGILADAKAAAIEEAGKLDAALKTEIEGAIADTYYNKTEIDGKLDTINQNLNTKVDANTVDSKIEEAKTEILSDAAESAAAALSAKVGAIEEGTTIKEYVDNAVGSGGVDVAEQIAQAKAEAISESKAYTDSLLTVVEF